MTTLLILTTGQSDAQLVCNNERRELDTKQCGVLHDGIKARKWSVIDSPTAKAADRIVALPEGDLTLCTPKLDAVLRWLGEDLPNEALIFETKREVPSDPRFVGSILEKRFDERGVKKVHLHAFLEGQARLEDPSKPDESVIRREIVVGLSKQIAARLASLKPERVVVATTGGLAAANEVIQELVRLHAAGCELISLEVADGALTSAIDRAVPEKFHPAAGFRARWHALSLIEKGNLLGAWGAASHLDGQAGQEWVQVVRWLADFASSLPIADACDLPSVKHECRAVRAALRVELALRAGDIPRAVHGTIAFAESALWDWLRRRNFQKEDQATGGNLTDGFTFAADLPSEKKKRFKRQKHNNSWRVDDFKDGVDAWLPILAHQGLSAIWNSLTDEIRNLRHDVAHNEPTTSLMSEARTKMRKAALWSDTDRFLSQPLVQDVLKELSVNEPDKLLANLLTVVRERLVAV